MVATEVREALEPDSFGTVAWKQSRDERGVSRA
jgi:hypothetical protein